MVCQTLEFDVSMLSAEELQVRRPGTAQRLSDEPRPISNQAAWSGVCCCNHRPLQGIRRRKMLEKACSYPAKELHSRALRARRARTSDAPH